jgi:hypothetical protein
MLLQRFAISDRDAYRMHPRHRMPGGRHHCIGRPWERTTCGPSPLRGDKRTAHHLPGGTIVRTSGDLPGKTHDLTVASDLGILRAPEQVRIIALADKGYQGAEGPLITPYKGRNKPEPQRWPTPPTPDCSDRANTRTPS